ncbi:MAG: acyl carrier protein [Symploca sp. SIO3C6]|uniref:Acyl carrier protein n=1 Tax=Symploca sp. SIO1C4 TaxID=2607765 RepID=A0A6B3N274_9CYAN|nr:acyl carrier protein [Symploca sp. SIO3C6]NER27249.1 acyl carrier protein [Symploca sp. SIO1C4]NET06424.1 acyl carrier protein [Symploca sp. SIO2B6]
MNQPTTQANPKSPLTTEVIQEWLITNIAEQIEAEVDEIDISERLDSYGLDSAQAMLLAAKLEEFLGFELSPTLVWHYPTIEAFSERLAEESQDVDSRVLEQVDSDKLAQILSAIEQLSTEEVYTAVATEKQLIKEKNFND